MRRQGEQRPYGGEAGWKTAEEHIAGRRKEGETTDGVSTWCLREGAWPTALAADETDEVGACVGDFAWQQFRMVDLLREPDLGSISVYAEK